MATTGPWAQRWAVRLSVLLVLVAVLVGVRTVLAVHKDGFFELDGNVVNESEPPNCTPPAPAGCGEDWEDVADGSTTANASTGIIPDPQEPTDTSIFTTGGSKDDLDVSQWRWTTGSVPDKDELLNAYAVRYVDTVYFGTDRYITNGTAQIGFWFFQNAVSPNPNGTFDGLHQDGDILILADFTNGGQAVKVQIFQWELGGPINGTLRRIRGEEGGTAADCRDPTLGDSDDFCATTNPAAIPLNGLWEYEPKPGPDSEPNTIPIGGFFEGGIDLAALGLADQCFSSFLAETRSSASVDATLKDHVLHTFQPCESGLVTTPKDGAGNNIPAGGLSIGAGSVQVKDSAELLVSGVSTWQGTLKFFLCGPDQLAPTQGVTQTTCETGGVQIGTDMAVDSTTDPPVFLSAAATVTSAGKYCWRGEFISGTNGVPDATDATAGECFTVNPVSPAIITIATAGPVPLGTALDDTATLSLAAAQPGSPIINPASQSPAGGTITFTLHGPSATPVCTAQNTIGTRTVTVIGNGNYLASNGTGTGTLTPTAAGTYYWIATYSGNPPNTTGPVSGLCGDSGEVSVVSPNTPTLTTNASADPPDGVPLGTAIFDVATISGLAAPSNGNHGTITFNAFGPFSNTTTCTGNPVYTSVVTITGNGDYNSATGTGGPFTPTAVGNYNWIASYNPAAGDVNNVAVSGSCGDANEGSLVKTLTPVVSTSQFFYPNDSATITVVSGGGNLAGTVQFRLWTNPTCSGDPIYNSGLINVTTGSGSGLSRTVETSNTSVRVSAASPGNPINLFWRVDYVSSNTGHVSVPGTCGMESSIIQVTDLPAPAGGGGGN